MTDDKNTGLKGIEAILFANSDLVNEKDLLKNIPNNLRDITEDEFINMVDNYYVRPSNR